MIPEHWPSKVGEMNFKMDQPIRSSKAQSFFPSSPFVILNWIRKLSNLQSSIYQTICLFNCKYTMVLPRASNYSGVFRAHAYRTARAQAAGQSWRQVGRRWYASGHHEGSKKASSDLPWYASFKACSLLSIEICCSRSHQGQYFLIADDVSRLIGSIAVTVPSATWLWQQGPKKSEHSGGHGHGEHEDHEDQADQEQDEGNEGNEGGESSVEREGQREYEKNGGQEDNDEKPEDAGEETPRDPEAPLPRGGEKDEQAEGEDTRPLGETLRNEPPNEISPKENKRTSGDEGLKEGPNESLQTKSQVTKSIDPDADEGKKDTPSDDIDKNHEGEQRGTRISKGDRERKVSVSFLLHCLRYNFPRSLGSLRAEQLFNLLSIQALSTEPHRPIFHPTHNIFL